YVYYGLGASQPTQCFELDPESFTEIPGSNKILRPALAGIDEYKGGYHRGRRELFEHTDAAGWIGKFINEPCPEGPWMTKYRDKYYLQYATPGTVSQWYCDIVMEGNSPTGPFNESNYNPVSMKAGGFIGSAGHSCVFEDRNGFLLRITTMWVGKHDLFERRLGLFPVTFDKEGRMITHTALGDYPMFKEYSVEKYELVRPGWNLLSKGKRGMASSSMDTFHTAYAADENVRTWWSAQTGNPGEWYSLDLGKQCRINALQINFAEQDVSTEPDYKTDFHAYKVFSSDDGLNWELITDKSKNKSCTPNDYIVPDMPLMARFIKIENFHTALSGKFAISDLRVFGHGMRKAPGKVKVKTVDRGQTDSRNGMIVWNKSQGAEGYLVRFGVDPELLNQCIQVNANEKTELGIHILIKDTPYFYRVDSFNDSGITEGVLFRKEVLNSPG
ncbi:MAG: discoidin domain-containing protein, partial [Bacteroidales bacterium]|nr:discoidin domain-containing protein [Bacteroidales bacterium]